MKKASKSKMGRPRVHNWALEVNRACDSILASGQMPTLERLRAQLGGGSNRDIRGPLNDWKAKTEAKKAKAVQPLVLRYERLDIFAQAVFLDSIGAIKKWQPPEDAKEEQA